MLRQNVLDGRVITCSQAMVVVENISMRNVHEIAITLSWSITIITLHSPVLLHTAHNYSLHITAFLNRRTRRIGLLSEENYK